MKRALVIGCSGQASSYLIELLLAKGYLVFATRRRTSTPNLSRIEHLLPNPNLKLLWADLLDRESLHNAVKESQPDEIYNCGAQSDVAVSFKMPEYTRATIKRGTEDLLGVCGGLDTCPKILLFGSSEMFGNSPAPQNEETLFRPVSPYAMAKADAFRMGQHYRKTLGMWIAQGIFFNYECVTASTPVIIRKNGIIDVVPIEEIVTHREDPTKGKKYVTSGDGTEVWDGGKFTKIVSTTATWNDSGSKSDKRVVQINCRGGFYEATEDHLSRAESGFVKTSSLKGGDRLLLKPLPSHGTLCDISENEAEFLGMMVADGWIDKEGGRARFTKNDPILRDRAKQLWSLISLGTSRDGETSSEFSRNTVKTAEFSGANDYLRFLRPQIYTESSMKRIPRRVLNGSEDAKMAFLRGYNRCDGLKAGHQKTEFKSFSTNSSVLASGLWMLLEQFGFVSTSHPGKSPKNKNPIFVINIRSKDANGKGKHLQKPINEIKSAVPVAYTGWLFDLETESGTFSAGVGNTWIHNSPRRGEEFVTRKITRALGRMACGLQENCFLGNRAAIRDWGHARDAMEAAWLMMQQEDPDDFVIATGETHTVEDFLTAACGAMQALGHDDFTGRFLFDPALLRPAEVNVLNGDASKARRVLGWRPRTDFKSLVSEMVKADYELAKTEVAQICATKS